MRLPLSREDVAVGARLFAALPGFFRGRLTPKAARSILRQRFERREDDFLQLARRTIYGHSASPYRFLLGVAGCEYGDLERKVRHEGVEGALQVLFEQGVYLTVDEFRGRLPVVRGSSVTEVDPTDLQNPLSAFHVRGTSGGSRGVRRPVPYDLACFWDRGVNTYLTLDVRGGSEWVKAVWGVPGGSMGNYLRFSPFGAPPSRWFVQVDPAAPGFHARYRWSARVLRWGGWLGGARIPSPRYVALDDPLPIARWLVEVLEAGGTPHLELFVSSAVRLCQAALQAGLSLTGAQFLVIGEATTAARLAAIRRTGAEPVPDYGSSEAGGPVGYGCLEPDAPDDIHLFHDLHALIQPNSETAPGRLPPRALLVSSLRASSPMILLNLSMGDQAELRVRRCGCPVESLGWQTHLRNVRSYEKLTAGGMTFLDTDVIRVLEETLPARFGGGPGDYQLVEEEVEGGRPSLSLLVHPRLGPLDDLAVAEAFLAAIEVGSGSERVMGQVWREAGLLKVERSTPRVTAGGKIQHLHLEQLAASLS